MEKYYLMPCARQNQKSFGCKAVVEVRDDGAMVLYPYTTKIAKITTGGLLVRLCDHEEKCSRQTTMRHLVAFWMRHLVAFCVNNGLEPITKKAWNAMPRLEDR